MFSLNYREMWSEASGWLADELDQIAASAQSKWAAQHDNNGRHRNFHATGPLILQDAAGSPYCLYVSGGTLYIVAGTSPTGGTVVGTQT
jgi:cysteine synthase